MAAKTNTDATQIDKSSFFWTGRCGICHPGGGPGEFDRRDNKYYDPVTEQFGFERSGEVVTDMGLDGDYTFIAGSGVSKPAGHATPPAAWDVTWTSEPDCLMCHRGTPEMNGSNSNHWKWRTATLRAMATLTDSTDASVPAFMAASAAGQGWFSSLTMVDPPTMPPTAATLDLDYGAGVTRGDLMVDSDGNMAVKGGEITATPRDASCWGCHAIADDKKRARVWFDPDEDVHYRYWSNAHDSDPDNDLAPNMVQACTICHPSAIDHQITKGDSFEGSLAEDLNYVNFLSCRECHDGEGENAGPVPPQGGETSILRTVHNASHLGALSCQACHIPFKREDAVHVVDNASTGKSVAFRTGSFLSADPLDPTNADKGRWYPSWHVKEDADGSFRIFPAKLLVTTWWGEWYYGQDGLPNTADDFIRPVILWRIRGVTGGSALPGTVDDNGDGKPEVNTAAEIEAYITRFRNQPTAPSDPGLGAGGQDQPDDYVLIKGGKIWYVSSPTDAVETYSLHEGDPDEWNGNHLESDVPFSLDHNVLDASGDGALRDCTTCHTDVQSNENGRKILIDPWGLDGDPIYETPDVIMARQGYRWFGATGGDGGR